MPLFCPAEVKIKLRIYRYHTKKAIPYFCAKFLQTETIMDIFDKIKSTTGSLGQYSDVADGYFMFPKLEGEIAPRMKFRGKEVLCWSLNNYLGLANNPEVRKTDAEATAISPGLNSASSMTCLRGELYYGRRGGRREARGGRRGLGRLPVRSHSCGHFAQHRRRDLLRDLRAVLISGDALAVLPIVAGERGGVDDVRGAGNLDGVLQFVGKGGNQVGLGLRHVDGDAEEPDARLGTGEIQPPGDVQEPGRHVHDEVALADGLQQAGNGRRLSGAVLDQHPGDGADWTYAIDFGLRAGRRREEGQEPQDCDACRPGHGGLLSGAEGCRAGAAFTCSIEKERRELPRA